MNDIIKRYSLAQRMKQRVAGRNQAAGVRGPIRKKNTPLDVPNYVNRVIAYLRSIFYDMRQQPFPFDAYKQADDKTKYNFIVETLNSKVSDIISKINNRIEISRSANDDQYWDDVYFMSISEILDSMEYIWSEFIVPSIEIDEEIRNKRQPEAVTKGKRIEKLSDLDEIYGEHGIVIFIISIFYFYYIMVDFLFITTFGYIVEDEIMEDPVIFNVSNNSISEEEVQGLFYTIEYDFLSNDPTSIIRKTDGHIVYMTYTGQILPAKDEEKKMYYAKKVPKITSKQIYNIVFFSINMLIRIIMHKRNMKYKDVILQIVNNQYPANTSAVEDTIKSNKFVEITELISVYFQHVATTMIEKYDADTFMTMIQEKVIGMIELVVNSELKYKPKGADFSAYFYRGRTMDTFLFNFF